MYQEYQRILAPIDGSNEAEKAFKKAIQVAVRNEAILDIAHVIDIRALYMRDGYELTYTDGMKAQAQKLLDEYAEMARKQGVKEVYTHLKFGPPKSIIAEDMIDKCQCDLIMLGATGLNAFERLVIGSVSEYVIRHAPCDVMVVRTDLDNN